MTRSFGFEPVVGHDAGYERIGAAIWKGAPQEILAPPDPNAAVFALPLRNYRCAVFRDGQQVVDTAFGGDRAQIMPPGVTPRAVFHDSFELLQVYVPTTVIDAAADAIGLVRGEIADPAGAADKGYADLMRMLARSMRHGALSALWVDSIGLALAATVLQRWATAARGAGRTVQGGLAPWAERRCTEMMRERLAEDISLADLAREARLSPFHFARMFKQSVGVAPHAFLVQCRIEKACALLATTDLSVTEIAQAVGYASSQALNRVFVKAMGATPTQYRCDRGS